MIYDNEPNADDIAGISKNAAPTHLQFEWMILYFILGMKNAVDRAVKAWCKGNGVTLKGHAVQKFSYLKSAYRTRIDTGDPEILALFKEWGLDPGKPLEQQRPKIEQEFQRRQKEEKAETESQAD